MMNVRNEESARRRATSASSDGGGTWPYKRVLEEGVSGYSDLAVLADGTILCAYGYGTADGNPFHKKGVRLARFDANWAKG